MVFLGFEKRHISFSALCFFKVCFFMTNNSMTSLGFLRKVIYLLNAVSLRAIRACAMLDLSKRKKTGNKYPKRTEQKVTNQGEESWLLLTPKQSDPRLSFREYITNVIE